jgi:trk system potassium uptake protein TrkH
LNLQTVACQLGLLLLVLSAWMLMVALWAGGQYLIGGDGSERLPFYSLLIASGVGGVFGAAMWAISRKSAGELGRREALLLVALSWFVGAGLAALPFYVWAQWESDAIHYDLTFRSYVDAYFEAMSGLTTTGSTVLTRIAALPRSLHLWRALTHWLGGLGIVVLFVAVLPMLGVGGKRLFRVEAPGPTAGGVRPRIQETARALWIIYVGLTLAEITALKLAGVSLFESVCHTFGTLATGGFSTRNGSVAELESVAAETIIIVFMLLAGVNFGMYYLLSRGRWRDVLGDIELRAYLGILLVAGVVVSLSLVHHPIVTTTGKTVQTSVGEAVRYGVFQVVSLQTTTGFCTADFDQWPFVVKSLLVGLMFVGGCGGSTGGGIKVIRCVIVFKVLLSEIEHVFRPNVIRPIRVGRTVVEADMKQGILAYALIILLFFAAGTVGLKMLETENQVSLISAATACAATLNNIGPGLEQVGAVRHFGWFSDPSKLLMCLLMAVGRLEVFAVAVLFSPRFWKGD